MTPVVDRRLRRLALAGALVVLIGLSLGLDGAIAVACALTAMELDAHLP
jgi:hypothetical protein